MVRRHFSVQPRPSASARPSQTPRPGGVRPEVAKFKASYVFERNILQRFRDGPDSVYRPAISLDGKTSWLTPEESPRVNVWERAYDKIRIFDPPIDPVFYVRVLFAALRGSSVAIPTVKQLPSSGFYEIVIEFLKDQVVRIRSHYMIESKNAETSIRINQKGSGYPLGLSVYYALVDPGSSFSPLFQYSLATETARVLREKKVEREHSDRLIRLAKRVELLAAMDYLLFPDIYDDVYRETIPSEFRSRACSIVDHEVNKCGVLSRREAYEPDKATG